MVEMNKDDKKQKPSPKKNRSPRRRKNSNYRRQQQEPSASASSSSSCWFESTLQALGHPDPSWVKFSLRGVDKDADAYFEKVVLYLEDRIIRLYDLAARDKLRNLFWEHIDDYLNDIECPGEYVWSHSSSRAAKAAASPTATSSESSAAPWRHDTQQRTRVMYWILATATSEAYNDRMESTPKWNSNNFPLGLATGDDEVDRILTVLRMKYLLQLRQEQDEINECITRMQKIALTKERKPEEKKK